MDLQDFIMLLDKYNLPWFLLALISWVIIALSCSWKSFTKALPVGIWTMLVGTLLENFFIEHKFWVDRFIMIHVGETDLFLIIGAFFFLGIILARFLPQNRWGRLFLPLLLSLLSTAIELLAIQLGFLEYNEKWSFFHSAFTYFLGLMSALGFNYAYQSKDIG